MASFLFKNRNQKQNDEVASSAPTPEQPPRDLFIDVRVLKDAGEIQTEYG